MYPDDNVLKRYYIALMTQYCVRIMRFHVITMSHSRTLRIECQRMSFFLRSGRLADHHAKKSPAKHKRMIVIVQTTSAALVDAVAATATRAVLKEAIRARSGRGIANHHRRRGLRRRMVVRSFFSLKLPNQLRLAHADPIHRL